MIENLFRKILKAYRGDPNIKFIRNGNLLVGTNTNIDKLNMSIRANAGNRKMMQIGNDCLIGGDFVFENGNGFISIGNNSFIGGSSFISINKIEIGNHVQFSWGCTVVDNNAHSLISEERKTDVRDWKRGINENRMGFYKNWEFVKSAPVIIKDKAWIGFNVIILKGVTIGEGAVIGAGSVVTKDVPDYSIAAGNPAIVVGSTK